MTEHGKLFAIKLMVGELHYHDKFLAPIFEQLDKLIAMADSHLDDETRAQFRNINKTIDEIAQPPK